MRWILFLIGFVSLSVPTFAQSAAPKCDGDITIVSVYQVKSGGRWMGFWPQWLPIRRGTAPTASTTIKSWRRRDRERRCHRRNEVLDTDVLTYHVHPPNDERTPEIGDPSGKPRETVRRQRRQKSRVHHLHAQILSVNR